VRAGWDGLYVATTHWQRDDIVVHVHQLQVPSDLAPGLHRVELGVYSPRTLERLPLYLGRDAATAPHARALLAPLRIE